MVTFVLPDRQRRLAAVRLAQEIGLREVDFRRAPGRWVLELDAPAVDRMEYLFELADHNGHHWTITDPAQPARAPGAFGEKSVLEFPGYAPPSWLDETPIGGQLAEHIFDALDAELSVTLWTPDVLAPDEPAALVAVHDGPEYDRFGGVVRYVGAAIARGDVAPTRVALFDPGDRNAWYSANPAYADVLCEQLLPALAPTTGRIGLGVSLGAVAMLHAHRTHPGTFDALMLQSGSFFTDELDPQELGFEHFDAVTAFTAATHAAEEDPAPVPTVLTCGTVEENLANNELMASTLLRLGYEAQLYRSRDAHNYTAWRDALHPHLGELIGSADDAA